jgi:hypothetical protein
MAAMGEADEEDCFINHSRPLVCLEFVQAAGNHTNFGLRSRGECK